MFTLIKISWLLSTISLGFTETSDNSTVISEFPDLLPAIQANIEDYPFLVHINIEIEKVELKDLIKFLMCVGSLIEPTWVMTSAHCLNTNFLFPELQPSVVSKDSIDLRVRLRKATPTEIAAEQAVKAVKVLMHPEYAVDNLKKVHNIGLLKLPKPFQLLPKSGVADIPDNNVVFEKDVTIVGYNQFMRNQAFIKNESHHAEKLDHGLQKMSTGVWPKDKCQAKSYGNPAAICIGESGKVPWIFDNGGPLLYENKIVGIALGSDNATEYAVYEDLYTHRSWIDSQIQANTTNGVGYAIQRHPRFSSIIYLNIGILYLIKFI